MTLFLVIFCALLALLLVIMVGLAVEASSLLRLARRLSGEARDQRGTER